jgi:hypothetical protein
MDRPTEGFDPVYMKILLDRGYQMVLEGYPWEKAQPGFILAPLRPRSVPTISEGIDIWLVDA